MAGALVIATSTLPVFDEAGGADARRAAGRRHVCNPAPRFSGAGAPCLPGDYRVRPVVTIRRFRDFENISDFKLVPLAGTSFGA